MNFFQKDPEDLVPQKFKETVELHQLAPPKMYM